MSNITKSYYFLRNILLLSVQTIHWQVKIIRIIIESYPFECGILGTIGLLKNMWKNFEVIQRKPPTPHWILIYSHPICACLFINQSATNHRPPNEVGHVKALQTTTRTTTKTKTFSHPCTFIHSYSSKFSHLGLFVSRENIQEFTEFWTYR